MLAGSFGHCQSILARIEVENPIHSNCWRLRGNGHRNTAEIVGGSWTTLAVPRAPAPQPKQGTPVRQMKIRQIKIRYNVTPITYGPGFSPEGRNRFNTTLYIFSPASTLFLFGGFSNDWGPAAMGNVYPQLRVPVPESRPSPPGLGGTRPNVV